MDYEVVWTEQATSDLEEITTYIAQTNTATAERIAQAIVDRVSLLRTVPLMGAIYPSGSSGRHRYHARQDPELPD
jgi:plasmid stabilization system protein ParE